jgi:hypothetical protein
VKIPLVEAGGIFFVQYWHKFFHKNGMKQKVKSGIDILSVLAVTAYLVLYCMMLQFEETRTYALLMLAFSPLLIIGMVYVVLKYGKYDGPELGEEEFGYQDKNKDDLGIF